MRNLILFFAVAFSCHSATGQDIDAATKDACNCLEDTYTLAEKIFSEIATAQAQGDLELLQEKKQEMEAAINKSAACIDDLGTKHPEIDESQALRNQVVANVQKVCPNPVGL